jgi:hypothetical protein
MWLYEPCRHFNRKIYFRSCVVLFGSFVCSHFGSGEYGSVLSSSSCVQVLGDFLSPISSSRAVFSGVGFLFGPRALFYSLVLVFAA